jgi:GDP-L-fucose synthase
MKRDSKIYVAGHLGLVGSAIMRKLDQKGYSNIIGRSIYDLNLLNQNDTLQYFKDEKPEYVILAAAKVGGIMANNKYRAQFIYENLQIQNNIMHSAYLIGVKKLIFLGSSCIYPKNAPQPILEEYLLTSELEYTNEPYAIAKIAGIKMAESYNIQYNTDFISVMPTNLYGPNDNYDLEKSHVLPAFIRKMHLAKALKHNDWTTIKKDFNVRPLEGFSGETLNNELLKLMARYGIMIKDGDVEVKLWGSGTPHRELMHSDDMADACVFLLENISFHDLVEMKSLQSGKKSLEIKNTHINIGTGRDLTICDLAEIVKGIIEFSGKIVWDRAKPDGTMQKLLDVSKINSLGWKAQIGLQEGIKSVYKQYCDYQI